MKTCCKCNESKDLSDFYSNKAAKDKKDSYCKSCRKVENWSYLQHNKKKRYVYRKKWSEENKDKLKELQNKYYKNSTCKSVKYKDYQKEYQKKYQKEYRLKNPDKYKEYQKEYRKKKKEQLLTSVQI